MNWFTYITAVVKGYLAELKQGKRHVSSRKLLLLHLFSVENVSLLSVFLFDQTL